MTVFIRQMSGKKQQNSKSKNATLFIQFIQEALIIVKH